MSSSAMPLATALGQPTVQTSQERGPQHLIETMDPKIRIVTFTGPSGSGKSTLMEELLSIDPRFHWMESVTTRMRRDSDSHGEYRYVNNDLFEAMRAAGAFAWDKQVHGGQYGTTKASIEAALASEVPTLMHLVPDCVPILRGFAKDRVLSFFVHVGNPIELRRRIQHRSRQGGHYIGNAELEERIQSCKRWAEEARASELPYIFINNGGTINEAMGDVIEGLKK